MNVGEWIRIIAREHKTLGAKMSLHWYQERASANAERRNSDDGEV